MSTFEILMPKMGESVEEATITKWFVSVGDKIEEDDVLLEIATDKVDSEIPSPVAGTVKEILYETDALVAVGKPVAVIALEGEDSDDSESEVLAEENIEESVNKVIEENASSEAPDFSISDRFYSPLVKSIAKEEGISLSELDAIKGTGKDNRVTKDDILNFVNNRGKSEAKVDQAAAPVKTEQQKSAPAAAPVASPQKPPVSIGAEDGHCRNGQNEKTDCRSYGNVKTSFSSRYCSCGSGYDKHCFMEK